MVIAEDLAKIAGHLTKETLALLAALLRREWQTKGQMPITNLKTQALKTGQTLEIFKIKKDDIPVFKRLARDFGVVYHKEIFPPAFLVKNSSKGGDVFVDVVGLSGDARGINHIIEKLGYPVPERDDGKNAEARAASEQNSPERGNGYERSRQSRPNRESEGAEAPGVPGTGDTTEPAPQSTAAKIAHYKKLAAEKAAEAKVLKTPAKGVSAKSKSTKAR
jgi:hypothetical protein